MEFLKDWAEKSPGKSALITSGIAIFAAVAVIKDYGIELESNISNAAIILGFGVLIFILDYIRTDKLFARVLVIFFAFFALSWIGCFIALRVVGKSETLDCLVHFWQPCGERADRLAIDNAIHTQQPALDATILNSVNLPKAPTQSKVFIQFAGYTRDTIILLAKRLQSDGWNVQGADRGGERIGSAAGLAEVRFHSGSATSEQAATQLAAAISAQIKSNVKAVALDGKTDETLEVWIGQK